jgi:adenosylcobinamide-phosphate synthase
VSSRAVGLVAGFAADAFWGDPATWHPVSGFGLLAAALERRGYADSRLAGVRHTVVLVGSATTVGVALSRASRRPALDAAVTAAATWATLGGRSLSREATLVHGHLVRNDLDAARGQVTHLVGRDPSLLDAGGVARATVESVAENTADAVVAPLLWGAVAGPAGLLGYRAANTLDAMVGHRSPRYRRFGWAAARLDDALNLVPARLTAVLTVAVSALPGRGVSGPGGPGAAVAAWRRDAAAHPSPNAGPVEAAFAGALGVALGGVNTYGATVEDRGTLGHGPAAAVTDIPRATRLAGRVDVAALILGVAIAWLRRRR